MRSDKEKAGEGEKSQVIFVIVEARSERKCVYPTGEGSYSRIAEI